MEPTTHKPWTTRQKALAWGGVAAILGISAISSMGDDKEYITEVETKVMQGMAGTNTPDEACDAGYEWACRIEKTSTVGKGLTVHTDLDPETDNRTAGIIGWAYLNYAPQLDDIAVESATGETWIYDREDVER